ncbi:MAG: AAA family ATPase [Bacteroidota bacterium]
MQSWIWAVLPKHYPALVRTETFALRQVGRAALADVRPGDVIFAYLSGKKVLAGLFEVTSLPFEDHTALSPGLTHPHRVRVRPVVTLSEETWVPYEAFATKLDAAQTQGSFRGVVQRVLYPLPSVDAKVLEFLMRTREAVDLDALLAAYDAFQATREQTAAAPPPQVEEAPPPYHAEAPFDRAAALDALHAALLAEGYWYEPWQVATYVAALRTKPFVILAGVTGIGKSKLPQLVARLTGGAAEVVPVQPRWMDSGDVIGYTDLQNRFHPGAVLRAAARARQQPEQYQVVVLDEMNVAKVGDYLAEVLSRMEQRHAHGAGWTTPPLLPPDPTRPGDWSTLGLPSNLALVGTVNIDEDGQRLSRKVLDRAFALELEAPDLRHWPAHTASAVAMPWPIAAWQPRGLRLADLADLDADERATVQRALDALSAANAILRPARFDVAFRTRDEVCLFMLHAHATPNAFRTAEGAPVEPLDLALLMKLLPRLHGAATDAAFHDALAALLTWAANGASSADVRTADHLVTAWVQQHRPVAFVGTHFPRTTARLCLMWERLQTQRYASFWR